MNKYELLAEKLHQQISSGQFSSTQKLPSVRQLCQMHDLSMTTVVKALELLEQGDVIESRERSGFYLKNNPAQNLPEPEPSYTLNHPTEIDHQELVLGLMKSFYSPDILNLGAAIPSDAFLPVKELEKSMKYVSRRADKSLNAYQSTPGNKKLRKEISKYMAGRGVNISSEHIIITSGCQEATTLSLLTILKAGDKVAVETPTYPGFLQICELLKLEVVEIPSDTRTGISIGALQLAIEQWEIKAVLVSSNFSNPTCSLLPDDQKQELLNLCAEHKIYVIEDDVYGDLSHDPYYRPRPIKHFDNTDTVIYCSSFSKTVSPGLRIGWMINKTLQTQLEYRKYVSGLASVSVSQQVIAHYLENNKHERFLQNVRRNYAIHCRRMADFLHEHLPEGSKITQPSGGFTLWVELPRHIDSLDLLEITVNQGVSFNPGILFSSSNKHRHCFRLNSSIHWDERLQDALKVITDACHRLNQDR